jgi:hypothetical protein
MHSNPQSNDANFCTLVFSIRDRSKNIFANILLTRISSLLPASTVDEIGSLLERTKDLALQKKVAVADHKKTAAVAKSKRKHLLMSKLKTKGKMIAAFTKMIASFPCQAHCHMHGMLFHQSAHLAELIAKQQVSRPRWKLGVVTKLHKKNGNVEIKCDLEKGKAEETTAHAMQVVARAFVLPHKEGARLPFANQTDRMDAARPLQLNQYVVYLSHDGLMDHCHGERSLLLTEEESSAHAFKVWRERNRQWLHDQQLRQWSELDFDETAVDFVMSDPLAVVHHQRFPGDPATGSGLRVLLTKLEQLKRRVQLRRSGFDVDWQVLVPQKPGNRGGSAGYIGGFTGGSSGTENWPLVSQGRAEYGDDKHDDGESELIFPLAHPMRPEGRLTGAQGRIATSGATYLSKLYAEAKSVIPVLADVCATVASHGYGLRSRGPQLLGPFHACEEAWNKYGRVGVRTTAMTTGGFSRVMRLLSCRIECDDEHDLEEALLQLRALHEDDSSSLQIWHTKRLAAGLSAYPLTYELTAQVRITVDRAGLHTEHHSYCTIELVALHATKLAVEPEGELEDQWAGDISTVTRKQRDARYARNTKQAMAARDEQVPRSENEIDQRRRLHNRTQWLEWYASTQHMPALSVRHAHGEDVDENCEPIPGAASPVPVFGIYVGQMQHSQRQQSCSSSKCSASSMEEDDKDAMLEPHGYGVLLEDSGARYEGKWLRGRRHGFGEAVETVRRSTGK